MLLQAPAQWAARYQTFQTRYSSFLVGAFYQNEPDYYSGRFFFLFFVRSQIVCVVDIFYRTTKSTEPASGITSQLLQRVPPVVYSILNVRYKTGRDYRVPPLNFFRHSATFFSNFLLSPNGPPFKFFDILQQSEVSKSPNGPPFLVFRHCETIKILIFRFF